jgi:hypothetical protein
MNIHPYGSSVISSMAAQASALKESHVQSEVNIRLLADAMEVQEDLMAGLLQSLGVGQNIDVVV